MDDLVTWLSGCLDEDEQAALIASEQAHPVAVYYLTQADISGPVLDDDLRLDNAIARYVPRLEGLVLESKDARLVYNPARVLAEVEARRALIKRGDTLFCYCDTVGPPTDPATRQPIPHHYDCTAYYIARELALPYRDRPGWRPEWAPDR